MDGLEDDGDDFLKSGSLESLPARSLLWTQIKRKLHPAEVYEVKRMLGERLIDKNQELFEEAQNLSSILSEFQAQNQQLRRKVTEHLALQDTPARKLLEHQIRIFIESLQAKNASKLSLIMENTSDRAILQYICHPKPPSAPSTGRMGEDPTRRGSGEDSVLSPRAPASMGLRRGITPRLPLTERTERPGTAISTLSAPDILQSDTLTIETVESAISAIRSAFKEETDRLEEDIEFLQMALEEETEEKAEAEPVLPELKEVQSLKSKLEQTLKQEEVLEEMDKRLSLGDEVKHHHKFLRPLSDVKPAGSLGLDAPSSPKVHTVRPPDSPKDKGREMSAPEVKKSSVARMRGLVQDRRDEEYFLI